MSATPRLTPLAPRTVSFRSSGRGRKAVLRYPLTWAVLAAALCPAIVFAQATSEPASAPAASMLIAPTTAPAIPTPAAPTPSPTPASPTETLTQPFVGTITADHVYVRSGPGTAYYELGYLSKGDLVQVLGSRVGWYQILPPNGAFCMVAKDLVDVDSAGTAGTVKADYVNVRAGTALNKNREPSAVLTVVRKGTQLTILGSTDKYYEVAPPEKAYVFVSPQFVKSAGVVAEYHVPQLKLPAGVTGPAVNTVTAPTTLPAPTVEIPEQGGETAPVAGGEGSGVIHPPAQPGEKPAEPTEATAPQTVVVPPQPAVTFSSDAYTRFNDLNKRYQAELQKPVGHRELDGLITDYKALATSNGVPPSVQQGSEARIAALQKLAAIQRLAQENTASTDAMMAQQRALQEQYSQAEQAIKDYEQTGPYLAQGRLQTSTAVEGKYALVNPVTGRVVAYVDPQSDIDISSLLGKYIGVRGVSHASTGTAMTVIQVKNATLLPAPAGASAPAARH